MTPADLLYCCNCTRRGHDSSTCQNYRWSQYFPTPTFVTNYTDGPQNKKRRKTASEDAIPLSNYKTKKENKTKDVIIPEGLGDIQNASILYRYGSFETSAHNGQILHKELDRDLYRKADNFLKHELPPSFLHELIKIVPFDLIIYRTGNKALFIRIRTFTGIVGHIQEIFIYWLKLNDEDKRSLKVYINIPRDAEKLLNIFYTKWEEMTQTADNPHTLTNEIKSLKSTLTTISDPSILHTTTDRILHLRSKLLNIYNAKVSHWPEEVRQITNRVRKSLRKKPKSFAFTDKVYLRCIHIYNEIHLPRTLTDNEMRILYAKYNEEPKTVNSKGKKLKKKFDPYDTFLRSYQQNIIAKAQREAEKQNPKNSNTTSSNIIREQSEKIPICVPTSSIIQEQNKEIPIRVSTENINQEQNKRLPACTTTGNSIQEQSKMIATCTSENVSPEQIKRTSVCTSNENVIQEHSNKIPIRESNENVTQENVGVSTDVSIESKAEKLINEVLEFKLPYMNKAVEEVKKRISNKNIKQEHIGVLQRLINLERGHQQYVSSFSSYLQ